MGATWNSQALMSLDAGRRNRKRPTVVSLAARGLDMIFLQELHSTPTAAAIWENPPGFQMFFAHGSHNSAGVGILVSKKLLANFDDMGPGQPEHLLEEIWPGRVARLRLHGPRGALHLFVIYFTTGDAEQERAAQRRALAAHLPLPHEARVIIAGDFNYTCTLADQRNYSNGNVQTGTGSTEKTKEETDFDSLILKPFQLHELIQEEPTHRMAGHESRLDRVYTNLHVADQLDHQMRCVALPWVPSLVSSHRPVWFEVQLPEKGTDTCKALPDWIFKEADWQRRVVELYSHWLGQEPLASMENGMRRYVLLKRAMQQVARHKMLEKGTQPMSTPSTPQEVVSHLMAFVRAVSQQKWHRVRCLAAAYGPLQRYQNATGPEHISHEHITSVKDMAVEAYKQEVLQDIHKLHQERSELSDTQVAKARGQIARKLRRLRPGATNVLEAIMDGSGEILTSSESMVQELSRHWGQVFQGRQPEIAEVEAWLQQAFKEDDRLHVPAHKWHVRRKDIAQAINMSGNSAAGPDGIPYAAWRAMGDVAIEVLTTAMDALQRESAEDVVQQAYGDEDSCSFNHSLICCIPKKPQGCDPEGNMWFRAADTRPIAIVDTGNRLLANAARIRWERILQRWISSAQNGFLPGRSILANVVDVEEAALKEDLTADDPAMILLDIEAAFPSIAHVFLRKALAAIGLPPAALRVVDHLYRNNNGIIKLGRCAGAPFAITAGIRQGCPLSPLMFIAVMDSLIRRIQREAPAVTIRMYADDTGLVLNSVSRQAGLLHSIFDQLHRATNLKLNIAKCVAIPLGPLGTDSLGPLLTRYARHWGGMQVASAGKYLGFVIGPGAGDASWDAPLTKLKQAAKTWPWSSMGLFFTAHVWNIYLLPILLYVAQLCRPPEKIRRLVDDVMLRTWPGPFNRVQPKDLKHLKELGFQSQFKDLGTVALAAQYRVAHWDSYQGGGLQPTRRVAALQALANSRQGRLRYAARPDWHGQHGLHTLATSLAEVNRLLATTPRHIENLCCKAEPRPWSLKIFNLVKGTFQKTITQQLQLQETYGAEEFVRRKLEKYGFRDRREATRALQRLRAVGRQVPPRVWTATFTMLTNRWATQQNQGTLHSRCLLGCEAGPDACHHYRECRCAWEFARKYLAIVPKFARGKDIWCLTAPPDADSTRCPDYWTRVSLAHYAVMRATNALRMMPRMEGNDERRMKVWRCLRAGLAEGVRDSPLLALARRLQPEDMPTSSHKRSREEELAEAQQAPPGQRVRLLINLM